MANAPVRDQLADLLFTPKNSALIVIDYQDSQFATVRSMDAGLLLKSIVSTAKTANTFTLPIVHSTVNVASGQVGPSPSSPRSLRTLCQSIGRPSTQGKTPTSSPPFVRPAAGNLFFARSGPKCAWRSPHSTRFARATKSIPSSTRSPGQRSKPTAPASNASFKPAPNPSAGSRIACALQRDPSRIETVPAIVDIVLNDRLLK